MTDSAPLGYSDTPVLPGTPWHVHDPDRPQPPVVTPGLDGAPPSDAVVLFDGSSLDNWEGKNGPAAWTVENGYMQVVPKSGSIRTRAAFGDCQLHVEFASPAEVKGSSQGRGNSGIFLMELYEVQVLDNFDNPTYPDGTVGSIYGQFPPLVNASRRPGEWSSYDIVWIGPRFDGDRLVSPARMTVILNGLVVQHNRTLMGPTEHKKLAVYKPHPPQAPLELQDHGDLVRFRNIWCRPFSENPA